MLNHNSNYWNFEDGISRIKKPPCCLEMILNVTVSNDLQNFYQINSFWSYTACISFVWDHLGWLQYSQKKHEMCFFNCKCNIYNDNTNSGFGLNITFCALKRLWKCKKCSWLNSWKMLLPFSLIEDALLWRMMCLVYMNYLHVELNDVFVTKKL